MKNKSIFLVISALLLIPLLTTTALADGELTATRVISDSTVEPGDVFAVTLTLDAVEVVQAPALDEDLPVGWTVTPVENSMGSFKASTNEWIWSAQLSGGQSLTVIYNVTVPADAVSGVYDITGVVSAHEIDPYVTDGDNTVTIPPVETPTPDPTATATPDPTATATPDPTATATPDPTATATPDPTATATPDPTATPDQNATSDPTATPEPTEISEFPIIAIPVMAILGMMFLLSRKK